MLKCTSSKTTWGRLYTMCTSPKTTWGRLYTVCTSPKTTWGRWYTVCTSSKMTWGRWYTVCTSLKTTWGGWYTKDESIHKCIICLFRFWVRTKRNWGFFLTPGPSPKWRRGETCHTGTEWE
jgi:hypothetical protein